MPIISEDILLYSILKVKFKNFLLLEINEEKSHPLDVLRSKAVVLGNEKILDNWSILIKNGKGKAEQIYEKTKEYIEEAGTQDIEADIVKVIPKSPIGKRIK